MSGKVLSPILIALAGLLAWGSGKSDTPNPQLSADTLPPRDYRQELLEKKDTEILSLKAQLAATSTVPSVADSLESLKDELAVLQGTIAALEAEKALADKSATQVATAVEQANPINHAPRIPYQIDQQYTYNYGFRGRNTATGIRKVWVYDDENGVTYYCSGQSGVNYGYSGGSCGPRGCN